MSVSQPVQTAYTQLQPCIDIMARVAWHVLWTRSNCERMVAEQLSAKGYEVFLPMIDEWSVRAGAQHVHRVPMFKGYLFVHEHVDKHTYVDIAKTNGLVRILGSRWDKLEAVPDTEIEAIRRAVDSELPITPFHYLESGDRVRIKNGPLINAEGIFVESDRAKGMFVVSVKLLKRSVAVEVDCTQIEPI